MIFSQGQRSRQKEMLDAEDIPEVSLYKNLEELDKINAWLGGHQTTIRGIEKLAGRIPGKLTIADIGCGGGDTLEAIRKWAATKNITVKLIGIDLLQGAITFTEKKLNDPSVTLICGNALEIDPSLIKCDIAVCSLVLHHLYDEQLEQLLDKMHSIAKLGVVINDLHRHPLAYWSILILTRLLSRSELVKNDAPLSVKKGFSRNELDNLLRGIGFHFTLEWQWAFRHLAVIRKEGANGRNL